MIFNPYTLFIYSFIHRHTIVRICPPQNTSLEDIFVNKDKIDRALRSLDGISIFSVEMVNPYAHHRQLLLGGCAGTQCEAVKAEGEEPMMEIIPESSENDQSIIPKDEREQDVEVVITNEIESEKTSVLLEGWNKDGKIEMK